MAVAVWLQNAVVSLGARGIAAMRPAFRDRVAQQMADNWIHNDENFVRIVDGNLRRVWPAMASAPRLALLQANALRTARAQLDHFWAWHARPTALRDAVRVQGLERLRSARPTVIAGAHQLGFEVALMRISMELSGALIYDPGATPLPRAAQRAWSRFHPQQVIAADGAARPALRALREGRPLLVLVEEPARSAAARGRAADQPAASELHAALLGSAMRFTPLVAWLVRSAGAQVVWLDIRQHGSGSYSVVLQAPCSEAEMADGPASARALASRLEQALRADPAGYWWGRRAITGLQVQAARQSAAKRQDSSTRESPRAG